MVKMLNLKFSRIKTRKKTPYSSNTWNSVMITLLSLNSPDHYQTHYHLGQNWQEQYVRQKWPRIAALLSLELSVERDRSKGGCPRVPPGCTCTALALNSSGFTSP